MLKLLAVCLILLFALLRVAAQSSTPGSLLSAIAKSRPDTGRITLFLQLGNYYLDRPGPNESNPDSGNRIVLHKGRRPGPWPPLLL